MSTQTDNARNRWLERMVRRFTAWAWLSELERAEAGYQCYVKNTANERKHLEAIIERMQPASLCGMHDIETIEAAFFNHDNTNGSESAPGNWEKRRDAWRSFKLYLATHGKPVASEAPNDPKLSDRSPEARS